MKGVEASALEVLKAYDWTVYQSLNRSDTRVDVLFLLRNYPDGASISDIARGIEKSYANTWGATVGDDKRYKKEYSLASLELISRQAADSHVFF
jgi:predicted transcriptional regulator with HTH domain